jgi:predicted ABC-type ATPase
VFPENPTCTLRLELIDPSLPIFAQTPQQTISARYLVEGDLWPDVSDLAENPEVYENAKKNLKVYDGEQDEPVMTMLMGSAGSGKNYQMEKYMNENKSFKRGLQGAVIIDTDEIMEFMPGYTTLGSIEDLPALLNYGAIEHGAMSVPVTHMYAADVYHDAAKVINDKLQQEVLDARKSFVMQGIGTKLYKVTDLIDQAKALGYKVNVLAVTADADVRWERARKRAVQTGRYVPKPATLKGHSADKWRDYLHDLQSEGKVDFYEVLET